VVARRPRQPAHLLDALVTQDPVAPQPTIVTWAAESFRCPSD
jgi:hypothetical protein